MIKLNEYDTNLYYLDREISTRVLAPSKKEAKEVFKDTPFQNVIIKECIRKKICIFAENWEEVKFKERENLIKYYENYHLRGE